MLCCRAQGTVLAFPSRAVREVLRLGALTPLPRAPSFALGVFAHRGQVLPLLDPLRLLQLGELKVSRRARAFVLTWSGVAAAVLAEEVLGLVTYHRGERLPVSASTAHAASFMLGVLSSPSLGAVHLVDEVRFLDFAKERLHG